jgi:hypothetical protein
MPQMIKSNVTNARTGTEIVYNLKNKIQVHLLQWQNPSLLLINLYIIVTFTISTTHTAHLAFGPSNIAIIY